jgi:hypothetical protein
VVWPRRPRSVVATGWALLAAVCLLWPGFGTSDPDAALPAGFAWDRGAFEALVVGPLAVLLLVHTGFYLLHDRRRRDASRTSAEHDVAPIGETELWLRGEPDPDTV